MCYNPRLLLCKKILYKGVEKSVIFWQTTREEFEQGFAYVRPEDNRLNSRTLNQLIKYNYFGVGKNVPILFDCRLELPCRVCLECTKARANEWALRCSLEAEEYEPQTNFFVTLTYNDDNIPLNWCYRYDSKTDSHIPHAVPTLSKTDTFKFMKHLRTSMKRDFDHDGIRFFMCGEYGTKFGRPHYHYCFFNLPLNDLYLSGFSKTGCPMYRSPYLERHWKKGFVTVQPFSIETARYTAQYCCKKLNKKDSFVAGREMEFINMSRRPAIGARYFFRNMEDLMSCKVTNTNDVVVSSDIYRSQKNKDGSFSSVRYGLPSAFKRYFKPVTDLKRFIDTEYRDFAYCLNKNNECMKDVLIYDTYYRTIRAENRLAENMSSFGFCYDTDRYNEKYLLYLSLLKQRAENLFSVNRSQVDKNSS